MAEPTMLIPLPDDMARLMKLSQWQAAEIARLRERVFELESDPKSGDPIPLAEPRLGDLRRSAERCNWDQRAREALGEVGDRDWQARRRNDPQAAERGTAG